MSAERTLAPKPDLPSNPQAAGPHFVLSEALNPELNGPFTFRYPDAFEEVMIGARMAELAAAGRATPINPDQLPTRARNFLRAIATLEYVIETAPKGWYSDVGGRPVLEPGRIGAGDTDVVLTVFVGYLEWAGRFRAALARPQDPQGAAANLQGQQASGGALFGQEPPESA